MSEYREQFKKFTGLNKRNENNVGAYCLWLESQLTQLQSANDKLKERIESAPKGQLYWDDFGNSGVNFTDKISDSYELLDSCKTYYIVPLTPEEMEENDE
jgi:hypothetical protein